MLKISEPIFTVDGISGAHPRLPRGQPVQTIRRGLYHDQAVPQQAGAQACLLPRGQHEVAPQAHRPQVPPSEVRRSAPRLQLRTLVPVLPPLRPCQTGAEESGLHSGGTARGYREEGES